MEQELLYPELTNSSIDKEIFQIIYQPWLATMMTKTNYNIEPFHYASLTGTQVFSGQNEIIKTIKRFQANTKTFWGACVDSSLPEFSVGTVKDGYINAKKRGVRILYITEITKRNLPYCEEIMQFAKLRHLRRVRGNFAVSDTEFVAGIRQGKSLVRLVRSDTEELVRQQRFIFDTLWNQATSANQRIEQLIARVN